MKILYSQPRKIYCFGKGGAGEASCFCCMIPGLKFDNTKVKHCRTSELSSFGSASELNFDAILIKPDHVNA